MFDYIHIITDLIMSVFHLEFSDFDVSKTIVSQLVQNSTDINQLSRLNPLYYPWL